MASASRASTPIAPAYRTGTAAAGRRPRVTAWKDRTPKVANPLVVAALSPSPAPATARPDGVQIEAETLTSDGSRLRWPATPTSGRCRGRSLRRRGLVCRWRRPGGARWCRGDGGR
ncbi:hypothetical protein FRAHR75_1090007 [Frankia sp. Hr75.2]|nr:hypothetical protein FRAHR75_1090007 [Frankia sp. Hr75.2]